MNQGEIVSVRCMVLNRYHSVLSNSEMVTSAVIDSSTGKPYPDSCVRNFIVLARDIVKEGE